MSITTPIIDNFDVAGTTSPPNAYWAALAGYTTGLQLTGDTDSATSAGASAVGADYYKGETYGPDVEVWGTFGETTSNSGNQWLELWARIQNPTNIATIQMYLLRIWSDGTIGIYRNVANAETLIGFGSTATTPATGDSFGLKVTGTGATVTLECWWKKAGTTTWTLAYSNTDVSASRIVAAGNVGLAVGNHNIDGFTCKAFGAGAPVTNVTWTPIDGAKAGPNDGSLSTGRSVKLDHVAVNDLVLALINRGAGVADDTATDTVSDSLGNTWHRITKGWGGAGNQSFNFWYTVVTVAGTPTITSTYASHNYDSLTVEQYRPSSGVPQLDTLTGAPVAQATAATTVGTGPDNASVGPLTPTQNGALVVGAFANSTGATAVAAGTGFIASERTDSSLTSPGAQGGDQALETKEQAVKAAISATATIPVNGVQWLGAVASFIAVTLGKSHTLAPSLAPSIAPSIAPTIS